MRIWLDDMRTPPNDSWKWAKTADEAIALLRYTKDERITEVSLDYDLGGTWDSSGGEKVANYIADMVDPPPDVKLHTWNPAGADRMRNILKKRYGYVIWEPAKGLRSA